MSSLYLIIYQNLVEKSIFKLFPYLGFFWLSLVISIKYRRCKAKFWNWLVLRANIWWILVFRLNTYWFSTIVQIPIQTNLFKHFCLCFTGGDVYNRSLLIGRKYFLCYSHFFFNSLSLLMISIKIQLLNNFRYRSKISSTAVCIYSFWISSDLLQVTQYKEKNERKLWNFLKRN